MKIISGIQQIGIGNPDTYKAWMWYRQNFSMDIPVFEEAAEASLMLPYTGGEPQKRHAVLAINIQGGGGFEIWQYTERKPLFPEFDIRLGDLGIYIAKIKSQDVELAYNTFKNRGLDLIGDLVTDPLGGKTFYVKDLYNNILQVEESKTWFSKNNSLTGGVVGAVIGVSDIDKALKLYSDILGYDNVLFDNTQVFDDFNSLPNGDAKYRRVILEPKEKRKGSFSNLFGTSRIELVEVKERTAKKIFKNRFWGDNGFIHLCFDIFGMDELRTECKSKGFPFTVDTGNSFDMGEAAGAFAYIEDPDGTLIEFVETHKVPILKKVNWYLNLRKRNPEKPLPNWMLKTLALNRVKN